MDTQDIPFEQFIIGALLKFDELDNVDISMLISDFERVKGIRVRNEMNIKNGKDMKKYSKVSSDGVIHFTSGYPFDILVERNYIRKKILPNLAGEIVSDYFQHFKVEDFQKVKKEKILDSKETLLNNLNILLISDTTFDYDSLLEYGFHHIDYFRSIVRASKYFKEEMKELEKYHMILIGSHMVNEESFLEQLKSLNDSLLVEVETNRLQKSIELSCYLGDYQNRRSWLAKESNYTDLLDRILECLMINQMGEKQKKYYPIRVECQRELVMPSTKMDLKVLCLDVDLDRQDMESLEKKLGFSIEFSRGDIHSVENRLGDFDIMIASNDTSNKLLWMSSEVREQAIDTGRTFSLLVTYQDQHIPLFDEDNRLDIYGYGSRIHLNYIVNDGSFSIVEEMDFHHLYDKVEDDLSLEQLENRKKKSSIKGVVEASVSLYNDCLRNPISDISCKDADTFDREYLIAETKEKKRQLDALEPIYEYDKLKSAVEEYLRYQQDGVITKKIDGLVIVNLPDSIYIKTTYEHKPLCAITIPKVEYSDNLREFYVQTVTNGLLNEKEKVGFYTRKFEFLPGVAQRPNEEQMKAIKAIEKKVDYHISPLIKNSWTETIKETKKDRKGKIKKHSRRNNRKK